MMLNNKNKKIKLTHSDDVIEDSLTNLPEPIKLHILSLLKPKQAVQTSALSKPWVSLWTWIPVLNFNSGSTKRLCEFDKFVTKVLGCRDKSVKLNKLTFNRQGSTNGTILKTVFGYVLSNGVKEVKACIVKSSNGAWPDCLHTNCSDSLTRLKLKSEQEITCRFLGQKSGGLFKNLTNLYLEKAIITGPDPFSRFPALEKLTLNNCRYRTLLNIRASQLLVLTIKCNRNYFNRCELSTPKLRIFKFRAGGTFPMFVRTTQADLPDVLDEVVFGYSRSIVKLLSKFSKELVTQCSPFRGLKFLKLDRDESGEIIPSNVKDYLLHSSADAKKDYT